MEASAIYVLLATLSTGHRTWCVPARGIHRMSLRTSHLSGNLSQRVQRAPHKPIQRETGAAALGALRAIDLLRARGKKSPTKFLGGPWQAAKTLQIGAPLPSHADASSDRLRDSLKCTCGHKGNAIQIPSFSDVDIDAVPFHMRAGDEIRQQTPDHPMDRQFFNGKAVVECGGAGMPCPICNTAEPPYPSSRRRHISGEWIEIEG